MNKAIRTILTVILLIASCQGVYSQVYSFRHFGLEQNIFPSRIECVNQGPQGELLIGTLTGLVVYNGYEFRTFTEFDGLAESAISNIMVSENRVYIGHWTGGLTVLNENLEVISIHAIQSDLNFKSITSMVSLDSQGILIGTKGSGLFTLNDDQVERILLQGDASQLDIRQLLLHNERVYAVTSDDVFETKLNSSEPAWRHVYDHGSGMINQLRVIDDQWYMATSNGAYRLIQDGARLELDSLHLGNTEGMHSIINDEYGNIWFASERDGIVLYNPSEKKIESITIENGLSYNRTQDVFCDREGTVWVATAAGLDQHLGFDFRLFDIRSGLNDNLVWDFTPISDNELLVAHGSGLQLIQLDAAWEEVVSTSTVESAMRSARSVEFIDGEVYVIDISGNLWYSSSLNSSFRMVQIKGTAFCMIRFDGSLWLGSSDGLFKIQQGQVREHLTKADGIAGNEVNGLFVNKAENELWLTTLGNGITVFHSGRFKNYTSEEGMQSRVIHDIAFGSNGEAWLATYDLGILRFAEDQFAQVSDSLEVNCFAVEIAPDGSLWIGHNLGVDQFDPATGKVIKYKSGEGFMGMEVNPRAMLFDSEGSLWMGTLMGLLRFKPSETGQSQQSPILTINEITLGAKPIQQQTLNPVKIQDNDLKVSYKAVSLKNPEHNRVLYRIVGLHDDWRMIRGNEDIIYNALPAGDFTLEIKACNTQLNCSSDVFTQPLSITPPFYTQWWFYTLMFFAALFVLFGMDRYRNAEQRDRKIILEDRLASKSQELDDLREERKELKLHLDRSELFASRLTSRANPGIENLQNLLQNLDWATSNREGFGSDHACYFEFGNYKCIGLIDIGMPRAVGSLTYLLWKRALERRMLERKVISKEGFQRVWSESVEEIESYLKSTGKVKDIASSFIVFGPEQNYLYYDGVEVMVKDSSRQISHSENSFSRLLKSGEHFYLMPVSANVIMATDGLFDQLNESGTKKYSKQKLLKALEDGEPEGIKAKRIYGQLEQWRGMIDIFDDIFIISFEYGKT